MRPSNYTSENSESILPDSIASIQFSNESKQNSPVTKNFFDVFPNKCMIYPNPGTGVYQVQMLYEDDYLLEVINAYGATVKTSVFKGKSTMVNIEGLDEGIYTFALKGRQIVFAQKVVKN